MYSQDELKSLHGFLKATGESNLKNMLVGGKMTETHLRMLLKVVRSVSEGDFIKHLEADTFPKVKLNAGELAVKESFWGVCTAACAKVGLLTAQKSEQKKAA
jgi:hypothetical protein